MNPTLSLLHAATAGLSQETKALLVRIIKGRELKGGTEMAIRCGNSWKDNASCEIGGYAQSGRVSLI